MKESKRKQIRDEGTWIVSQSGPGRMDKCLFVEPLQYHFTCWR